jgi:hypothetical protein
VSGQRFPQGLWPADDVVDRLLVAADSLPPSLDRPALQWSLHEIRRAYLDRSTATKTYRKTRIRTAQDIENHAAALCNLLAKPPDSLLDFQLWPLASITREGLLSALRELAETARIVHIPKPSRGIKDWFPKAVRPVYERHFGAAKISREGDNLTGPFINFTRRLAREMQFNISEHTIHAALKPKRARVKNQK